MPKRGLELENYMICHYDLEETEILEKTKTKVKVRAANDDIVVAYFESNLS